MFFILSKVLSFLLQPLTWVLLFLVLAFVWKKKKKLLLSLSVITLLFFSNLFIADEFTRLWQVPAIADKDVPLATGVIVLGGNAGYDKTLNRVQFYGSSDRFWQGYRLLKQGKANFLIFTGGSGKILEQDLKEADYLQAYLKDINLLNEQFWFESKSRNTYENALFTQEMLKEKGLETRNYILVTSGVHMRRSRAIFKKMGYKVTCYTTDRIVGPRKFEFDHMLIPHADALTRWNMILREMVGYVVYAAKGYL